MQKPVTYENKWAHFYALLRQSLKGIEHDYTKGSIKSAIVLLAIPMILELSLESVFAVVDMFFVGKLGANAIATVALTELCMTLIYSIAMGLGVGATAVVSRRIGEGDPDGAAHAGMQSLLIAGIIAFIITICGIIYAPGILRLLGAAEAVVTEGAKFSRIMMSSSLFIILLFLINGIFRGAGDAAMAMKSLWIASLTNIILCPLLINGYHIFPQLGVTGAAVATAFGRAMGVCYQCYHLFKGEGAVKVKASHFKWDFPIIKTIIKVASPATFQFIIQSGSWIVIGILIAKTGGTVATAGCQVAIRNVVFFILPAWGLSNAAATLVGQNLGAKQPDRAQHSVLLCTKYNAIFMSFVMLLFLFFATPIIGIYTKDAQVQHFGVLALQIMGSGYIFYGVGMVMIQALNGAGDTKTPTWINLAGFWFFQVPLAYILAISCGFGPIGAISAVPISESCIAMAAWYFFRKGKWKLVQV